MANTDHTTALIENGSRLTKVGFTGAAGSPIVNWLVDNSEIITLCLGFGGFAVAVTGLGITWYYSHQRFQLLKKEHDERLDG